jgi:hypothetical protein
VAAVQAVIPVAAAPDSDVVLAESPDIAAKYWVTVAPVITEVVAATMLADRTVMMLAARTSMAFLCHAGLD